MTDHEIGMLVIFGIAALVVLWRKKPQKVSIVEVFEVFELPRRRRVPGFIVNMAIVAAIAAFIWIMNR
jgi:hypothetical protein